LIQLTHVDTKYSFFTKNLFYLNKLKFNKNLSITGK
jgi:hypothetical protein